MHTTLNRSKPTWLSTLILVGALLTPTLAMAGWTGGNSKPTMRDFIPKMSSDEAYSERYSFASDFDNGDHVGVDFTISNLGLGDHNVIVDVRLKPKGKKKLHYNEEFDDDEWRSNKKSFDIRAGNTQVKQAGKNKLKLLHNGKTMKIDLVFENSLPMWRPGKGKLKVNDGYFQYDMIVPRGKVTGRIWYGGKWHKVTSTSRGYADHTATNVAPHQIGKRFSRFRQYNKDLFIVWREIDLTGKGGKGSAVWILVGYKGKIVFSSQRASMKEARLKNDSVSEYKVPHALQIDARDGKDSISLVMQARTKRRRDLLAGYNSAVRSLARTVSKPYSFNMKGKYTIKMNIGGSTATLKGKGHYTMDYLNP